MQVGLDCKTCKVLVHIEEQSPDIGQSVHGMGKSDLKPEEIGAGDQGHMFGYATDETPEYMPLTHVLATQLGFQLTKARRHLLRTRSAAQRFRLSSARRPSWYGDAAPRAPLQVRKDGTLSWVRPDGKIQVTVEYKSEGGAMVPQRVHTILISTQHNPEVTNEQIKARARAGSPSRQPWLLRPIISAAESTCEFKSRECLVLMPVGPIQAWLDAAGAA